MPPCSERSSAREFNTWVQTIGIIIAAVWAAYAFIYKEVTLPKSAPVNITMDLQLKKIGGPNSPMHKGRNASLIAIEMAVSATNPSLREVYLLPSTWFAYGSNVIAHTKGVVRLDETLDETLNSKGVGYDQKHATASWDGTPVAGGRLFSDDVLKPNERISRKLVFHVPPDRYDLVDVVTSMPTSGKKGNLTVEMKFDKEIGGIVRFIYRIAKNGERIEIEKDEEGNYVDDKLELQEANSSSTLSLWQYENQVSRAQSQAQP